MHELGIFEGSGEAADALVGEANDAGSEGEQGVVAADFHVLSRADFGATLANQDVADLGELTSVFLHA